MKTELKSDKALTLDWASLGRLVRVRALDAVAMHFAVKSAAEEPSNPIQPDPATRIEWEDGS